MPEAGWQVDFWHWLVLSGVLLIVEVLVPGFFRWLAAAAALVGLTMWLAFPAMGWEYQILLFAVVSVASIVAFRRFQYALPPEQ
jgi:membrane protein implicated in regulation of membrane protease activity